MCAGHLLLTEERHRYLCLRGKMSFYAKELTIALIHQNCWPVLTLTDKSMSCWHP